MRFNKTYTVSWRRQWHPTPVLLPGKSHGQRGLVGCSPWGREESDTTERLHFHFSLSCIGKGNGSPLQCSCLENPRTGEPGRLQSTGSLRVRRLSDFTFTFHFHALEKEMAPHSSVLAWRIPGQGSLVGCHLWCSTELDMTEQLHFHFHAMEKEMATHSSVLAWRIPGRRSLVGCHLWGRTELDTTEAT